MSNSPEDQQVLDQLVYRVCRAFYEPKYIVVMDVINKLKQVKDEELATALKLNKREIHKICGKLKEDRLIKDLTKHEARKPDQRPIPNTYYYLDYKMFVDVVKYKIHRIGKDLDSDMSKNTLQAEVEHAAFRCPACMKEYSLVDVTHNMDLATELFMCPDDNTILENVEKKDDQEGQESKTRLRENTKPIVDLLKLTDNIVIEQYTESMASKNAAARTHDDDDLAFAEDGGQQPGEIQVVFQDDNDKAAKKARENEANKKRQQNAVPSWHAWSTVSGEMTTLGAEAAKRQEMPPGGTDVDGDGDVQENDLDENDYAQDYYEKLAAQNGVEEDESYDLEDKYGYDNGKRSLEDLEDSARKRPRSEDRSPDFGNGSGFESNGVADGEEDFEEDGDTENYPSVQVGGEWIPLLEVTTEHQSLMSPEEYEKYYEICQQYQ